MKRLLLAAAAALALAACADGGPTAAGESTGPAPPIRSVTAQSNTQYTIYTSQTPGTTGVSVSPGYELGTEFHVTQKACVMGMRFWRSAGETGTNTLKLWSSTGALLASQNVTTSGSGWQYVYLSGVVCLDVYTSYRVSVNVNSKAVKTSGGFQSYIVNQPLVGMSGYYGSPGSRPTTAHSDSYFVDVIVGTGFVY